MREQVRNFIEKWNMIEPGNRVLVGVSGGADSVCLCLILAELAPQMGFSVEVIHVEHGIRGEESVKDARFVQELCGQLGLSCHMRSVDVPEYSMQHHLSEEEAARILRYEAFSQVAEPGDKVALAHHREDNAETMLFQLMRGSGIDGLCGMRPVREGKKGEIYIRPILAVGRDEIETYLKENKQPFCSDSTNANLDYSRNRIRHKILPELAAVNEQAVLHMNQTAEKLREVRDYLDEQVAICEQDIVHKKNGNLFLDAEKLKKLPYILGIRVLHRAMGEIGGKKDITGAHLEAVWKLLDKQTGRSVSLPYGVTAGREYWDIVLKRQDSGACAEPEGFCVEIQERDMAQPSFRILLPDGYMDCRIFPFDGNMGKIPRKIYTKWLDYDMIKNGFSLRTRRPKDFFILDAAGHHKKIEDYYVDEKIPAAERDRRLLLTQEGKVLWIVGGRMGYDAGITKHTRTVFEITYVKEE